MARHHMPISVAANERIRVRTLLLRCSPFPVAVLESEASQTTSGLPTSTKKAVQCCIGTRKPSLLRRWGSFLERGSGGANSFGVGRAGETEGSRELGGVEEIG